MRSGSIDGVALSGAVNLVKSTGGTVTLDGTGSNYTGTTQITGGTLQLNASDLIPNTSTLIVNGGTFAMQTFDDTVAGVQLLSGTISGTSFQAVLTSTSNFDLQSGSINGPALSGSVDLVKSTGGTVMFGANQSNYTGVTQITDGTLQLTQAQSIPNSSEVQVGATGAFDLNDISETVGALSGAGAVLLGAGSQTNELLIFFPGAATTTFSGSISENGGLDIGGPGELILSGTNTFTSSNSITSGVRIGNSANLRLQNGSALPDGTDVSVGGTSTLFLDASETVGSIRSGAGAVVNLGANTLTLAGDSDGANQTFGGDITGTGSLVKTGSDTFTLSGTNTYTGTTTVSNGTLLVNGSLADGTSDPDVLVQTGATLGGTGTINGSVEVQSGGTIDPGVTTGILNTGDLTVVGNFDAEVNGPTVGSDYDQVNVTGTVDITGATLALSGTGAGITPNDPIVIINNDGVDAVTGTFLGLPEGAPISVGAATGIITYMGGDGNDVVLLIAGAVTYDAAPGENYFEFRQPTAGTLQLLVGATQGTAVVVDTRPLSIITSYTINAADGNDLLNVNYGAAGGQFDLDINYNGQTQAGIPGDTLQITGGTADTVFYNYTNANNGSVGIDFDGGGVDSTITYTGLEPITSTITAANVVLNYTGGTETITLSSAGAGMTQAVSTLGEMTTFNNPTSSLTVQTDNGTGTDTVNLQGLGGGFNANFTIDADGDDAINFQTNPTNIGAGNLLADAQNIDFSATVSTTGTIRLVATNDVTETGAGVIIANSLGIVTTGTGSVNLPGVSNLISTLAVNAAGSVVFNNTGAFMTGTVTAVSPFPATSGVTTSNGSITLTADGTITATTVNAGGGGSNVNMSTTTGNVLVDNVQAVGDQITITSAGTIEENGADAGADLVANTISLTAQSGIGTIGNVLEINAGTSVGIGLSAVVNASGDIYVSDVNALRVLSATTNDGSITLNAGGTMTVESVVAGGSGDVLLTTSSGNVELDMVTAMGDDVTVNAAAQITDLNGSGTVNVTAANLLLMAGNNISTNIQVTNVKAVSTNGTIQLRTHQNVNVDNVGAMAPAVGLSTSGSNSITLDDVGGPFTFTLVIPNGISDNSPVILNNGANLDLNNDNETIGSLAGDGDVFLGTGTLTTGAAGSTTYNGDISGTGGLTKVGGTTFTLTGTHTYDGLTSINAGTLTMNGTLDGTANVELNGNNTTLNGSGSFTDRLIQLNGGFANMAVSGSLTLTNAGNTVVNVIGSGSVSGATIQDGTIGVNVTPTGSVTLTSNTVNNNTTGINVASGGTAFFGNGNVINGGTTGLLVSGPTPPGTGIGNRNLANTSFNGQTTYISLQNEAHEGPEVINATATSYDGMSASMINANPAQRDAWELKVDHFPDNNELGLLILATDTSYIDPNSGDLIVIGSFGRDRITINSTYDDRITVRTNLERETYDLSGDPNAHIVVFALDDRDYISLTGYRSNEVFAGEDNDTIYGGHGDDVLRGEGGDDFINGRNGNDVVIGGFGADRLYASAGDDVLIGGHLVRPYDEIFADLNSWLGGANIMTAFASLVTDLTDPVDDANKDRLVGYSGGREAFIARPNDILSGFGGSDEEWTNW